LVFRIIASQANIPPVYIPLEAFQSKWYGETEKTLAEMFKQAEECGKASGGVIVFLDELDIMATSRAYAPEHASIS
jgi:SpoVK/Ycf46/Vps4 family AAA+-type ATPase